ncbi:HET-domain-containing protein [Annulohypoxylon moriforme]|nr:HET-domain-containing protein [Annulohypoxylon moriforme]
MHLLDVKTRRLRKNVEEKSGIAVEKYAILSHRWLAREDEILFQDIESNDHTLLEKKLGLYKLTQCCKQAESDGLKYVWIDSCCVNRSDSTELQEVINSMYRYYENSQKCYVYLKDTLQKAGDGPFRLNENEDWFQRGWTLQELIAPREVHFYNKNWQHLGDKKALVNDISIITSVDRNMLLHQEDLQSFSIAERMSWASGRKTTRDEDRAYSLIGLFNVNMPMLYGEGGTKAFLRLQEAIIKTSDDHSIFAWEGLHSSGGLLAESPDAFRKKEMRPRRQQRSGNSPFSMTNRGLSITLNLTPWTLDTYMALLNCECRDFSLPSGQVGIFLRRNTADDQYSRVAVDGKELCTLAQFEEFQQKFIAVPLFIKEDELRDMKQGHGALNGFRIENELAESSSVRGRWDPEKRIVTIVPGKDEWRDVGTLELSGTFGRIGVVNLGFDFEFNPTIFLGYRSEPISLFTLMPQITARAWNRINIDKEGFKRAVEGKDPSIWALKGDRIDGLTVRLGSTDILVILTKETDGGEYRWVLSMMRYNECLIIKSGLDDNIDTITPVPINGLPRL